MDPRIQYAKTSDGVNIAYATVAAGNRHRLLPSESALRQGSVRNPHVTGRRAS